MHRLVPALVLSLLSAPAFASGGLSCDVADDAVTITIQSGITHGLGSPLFNFRGEIEIRQGAVGDRLRRTTFEREHVPQYWIDDDGLRLRLYRETEAGRHGSVEAVIVTGMDEEEMTWDGTYTVTVFDAGEEGAPQPEPLEFSGSISCFVE